MFKGFNMIDLKGFMYSAIASAIIVVALASINESYAYIAVVVASIVSGILVAYMYSGEYLKAHDIVPITSAMGFGTGYLVGIGITAVVYTIKGRIIELAELSINPGYITLLLVTLFLSYVTGLAVYSRIWRYRRVKTRRR